MTPLPPAEAASEGTASDPETVRESSQEEAVDRYGKAEIKRLGRARPAVFKSVFAEVAFVATVVMSMSMSEYFISGFNVILPPVAEDLHIAQASQTWPSTAINIATASLLLPFARLCDIYGGRSIFLGGHFWMLVWSLICGFSVNPVMLIVCRAMQGVGAAAFVPAGLALLGQTYRPGPRKNLVFSVWGALACVGFYFGILIAAVSANFLTWRWFFWIGSLIVLGIVVSGVFSIPKNLHDIDPSIQMDWLGVATILPGLVLVVFALTDGGHAPRGWHTPYIYIALIVGVLFLAVAVYTQGWVSAQPLLSPDLFKPKYMKRLVVILFCSYGTFGVFLFYSSVYMENIIKASPIQTAVYFTPLAVGGIILAISGGFVLHLIPNTILMYISGLGFLVSVLLFALIPDQTGPGAMSDRHLYWAYIFPAMIGGTIGVDICFNVTNVFITTAMPARLQASASGLINSVLYLGMSFWLGVSELAISLTKEYRGGKDLDLRSQYKIGFWLAVAMAGTALLTTLTVKLGHAESAMTADEKAAADALEADSQSIIPQERRDDGKDTPTAEST